jgi:hypothetical protein
MFIPASAKLFDTEMYTVIWQACYVLRHFSATVRKVFDIQKQITTLANYDVDVQF